MDKMHHLNQFCPAFEGRSLKIIVSNFSLANYTPMKKRSSEVYRCMSLQTSEIILDPESAGFKIG